MAVSFDDLVPQKTQGISFDDLVPQTDKPSALKTFGITATGSTIPFGQSITSGLAAGAIAPFVPETFGQLYDTAQEQTRIAQEENPKAALAGNVTGIAATLPLGFSKALTGAIPTQGARGVLNAIPAGLSKVGDFVRGGSVAKAGAGQALLRGAKAGAIAAPVAGLYGAGEADAEGNRLQRGIETAGVGALIGASLPIAGAGLTAAGGGIKNIAKGIGARGEGALNDALMSIKDSSRGLYAAADQAGVMLKQDNVQDELLSKLSGVVKNKDIASQKLYSNTLSAIKDLSDDISSGNTGLMTLDRHRQILGNLSKDITNPNKAQEAEAAGRAIDIIDNFVNDLSPNKLESGTPEAVDALLGARKEWAKGKKFEKISNIIVNSGDDANKLKRDLEKFRTNPKNTLGWSAEELNALKQASSQTTGEGILKLFGKFGFDLGSGRAVGNTALPVLGSIGAGLGTAGVSTGAIAPAAAVATVGTAARAGQKAIARGKAESLLQVIEQGGKITNKMVNELPAQEKKKFLSSVMQLPVAQGSALMSSLKQKVK